MTAELDRRLELATRGHERCVVHLAGGELNSERQSVLAQDAGERQRGHAGVREDQKTDIFS